MNNNNIFKTPEERIQNIHKISVLGEGTYGKVYKARFLNSPENETFALKKCKIDDPTEGIPATTVRELLALQSLQHPNITQIKETIVNSPHVNILMEFKQCDLKKFMNEVRKVYFNPLVCKHILFQLLKGLHHMHSHQFLHRDIKPQNILVDYELNSCPNSLLLKAGLPIHVQLADLGLARMAPLYPYVKAQDFSTEVCTLWYRPLELLLGATTYDQSIDIWSMGVTFVEIITGTAMFPSDSHIDQIFRIFQLFGNPSKTNWPEGLALPEFRADFPHWKPKPFTSIFEYPHLYWPANGGRDKILDHLLQNMLRLNPKQRFSAEQCLQHPYFDEIRKFYSSY